MDEHTVTQSGEDTPFGDSDAALETAFLDCKRDLTAFVRRKVGDADLADDVVQDVYVRASGSRASGIENPRAFLFSIAGNLIRDMFRRKKVRSRTDLGNIAWVSGTAPDTPETEAIQKEDGDRVRKAFSAAKPREQAIFVMHWKQGLKYAEIAETLDISLRTVERDMARILKRMMRELED